MCGPPNCLLCEPRFMQKLKEDRLTQIWVLLWMPLLILWFIYLGFAFDKLVHSEQDQTFELKMHLKNPTPFPAWTVCPSSSSSTITFKNCTLGSNNTQLTPKLASNNCTTYFSDRKIKAGEGHAQCNFVFAEPNQSGYVYVHHHTYNHLFENKTVEQAITSLSTIPNGLFIIPIKTNDYSEAYWKRIKYYFLDGPTYIGYERLDFDENPTLVALNATSSGFVLKVGDYWENHYQQVQWYSGYDFWYFMGMLGGSSFLLLMLHTCAFYPFKRMLESDEEGATAAYTRSASYTTDSPAVGSSGVGGGYGSL
ncbi:hypothetical protein QOT17_012177 [Balamuthia mandrillaris]